MNIADEQQPALPGGDGGVQRFYERHPYPEPIDSLDPYRRHWQDPQRRRADHHLFQPAQPYREDLSILIAGCGTSQAAKHAIRWPGAQVTGIDFSATSVRCTQALKRDYRLDNLHLHQLALDRVGELGACFDQIVCTGVLHHLADPDAGLDALRRVLKPEGAMHLMVYAPYGRTGIYMLQDFCRRVGIAPTTEGLADLAAALQLLPRGHPLQHLLREAPDFGHAAALADALLHPQDRAYSVPQLLAFLAQGGLRFGRWLKQAPYHARCGVLARLPQAGRLAALPLADQFAAAELFRGTMVMHSVVAYRSDHPGGVPQPAFSGDTWLGYVPISQPDTVCVQERLPPGAAAVLINRSHTDRDLVLPIDAQRKALFDAIDGKRSIGEITAQLAAPELARALFEDLWLYDHVVFDTSRGRPERAADGPK